MYSNEEMEAAYPAKLVELLVKTRNMTSEEAEKLMEKTKQKLKNKVQHTTKVRIMAELGYSCAQVHEAFCSVAPANFLTSDHKVEL